MPVNRILRSGLLGFSLLVSLTAGVSAQSSEPAHPAQALRPGDHVLGAEDATLTMIEYASFACPHCAHFQADAWPVIEQEFVETGQVRWALRPMLTQPVQLAAASTILAECAPDDRYFDAADLLFSEQSAIFEAAQSGGDVLAIYHRIGAAVGVSPEQFNACLADPAMGEWLNAAAMQASEDGIAGTPSFIVGGRILATANLGDGYYFTWGGEPLLLDGERVPGQLDGDTFRRIVLHFLALADSSD
ncbi:thioredoxin domain-containing protein [Maricaulis sp. CAU 1757]